jgi:hypothetical protein
MGELARVLSVVKWVPLGGVWLVLVYLHMGALCEGFQEFIQLLFASLAILFVTLILVLLKCLPATALLVAILGLIATLPAAGVIHEVEARFARRNLAQIEGALIRYRAEHGAYPRTLDALRPRYLKSIPSAVLLLQRWQPNFCGTDDAFYLDYQLICGPRLGDRAISPSQVCNLDGCSSRCPGGIAAR